MHRRNANFLNFPKNLMSAFLIGVRNAYLHLYRNCGSIAKKYKNNTVNCLQSWTQLFIFEVETKKLLN